MRIESFLQARIVDDEAAAHALEGVFHGGGTQIYDGADWAQSPMTQQRLLAECTAKRAIVIRHRPDRQLENWYWSLRKCAECGHTWHRWINNDVPTDIGPETGCHTLRALAFIYKDHPDYSQEWTP